MVPEAKMVPASAWGPCVTADIQEKWKGREASVKRRDRGLTPETANPLV